MRRAAIGQSCFCWWCLQSLRSTRVRLRTIVHKQMSSFSCIETRTHDRKFLWVCGPIFEILMRQKWGRWDQNGGSILDPLFWNLWSFLSVNISMGGSFWYPGLLADRALFHDCRRGPWRAVLFMSCCDFFKKSSVSLLMSTILVVTEPLSFCFLFCDAVNIVIFVLMCNSVGGSHACTRLLQTCANGVVMFHSDLQRKPSVLPTCSFRQHVACWWFALVCCSSLHAGTYLSGSIFARAHHPALSTTLLLAFSGLDVFQWVWYRIWLRTSFRGWCRRWATDLVPKWIASDDIFGFSIWGRQPRSRIRGRTCFWSVRQWRCSSRSSRCRNSTCCGWWCVFVVYGIAWILSFWVAQDSNCAKQITWTLTM